MTSDRLLVGRKSSGTTGFATRWRSVSTIVPVPGAGRSDAKKRRRVIAAICLALAGSSVAGLSFFVGFQGPSHFDRLVWATSLDPAAPRPADFVPQRGDSDCGPASLKMVLGHHGLNRLTLEEIESAAVVGLRGTSLLTLKQIAEDQGLQPHGLRLSIESLTDVPMPAIAHVHGDHFVVLRRVDGSGVVVDDPSIGRLRMSTAKFGRAWDGVVLVFKPASSSFVEPIQPSDKPTRVAA